MPLVHRNLLTAWSLDVAGSLGEDESHAKLSSAQMDFFLCIDIYFALCLTEQWNIWDISVNLFSIRFDVLFLLF